MTRTISIEEFKRSSNDLVKVAGQQTVLIQQDGETVAVLTSLEQYETTREAKADKAIRAMWSLRDEMQITATREELVELEKALDRKAS